MSRAPRGFRARVDAKGRVTIPKALRVRLGLARETVVLLRAEGEELRATTAPALLRSMRAARVSLRRRLDEGEEK